MIDIHLNFSAMDVALGEIYAGVFSACSVINSFDVILMANWFRLRTSSGKILEQQELPNMIVSDAMPQIYSSNADLENVSITLFFWDVDELDYWFCISL